MCNAKTLIEQQEVWPRIRRVLLSRALHWTVVSTEWFAWKAAGVPPAQRRMIVEDHRDQIDSDLHGEAIWEYVVNTLDPVVKNTLVGDDNYFYLLCLQGRYSQRCDPPSSYSPPSQPPTHIRFRRCHPQYLSNRAHRKLSQPGAFDGVRIHTDELQEVICRIAPGTLSHAVVSQTHTP